MRKFAVLGAVLFTVAACQDSTSPRPVAVTPDRVNSAQSAAQNDYIVVFRDDVSDPEGDANTLVRAHGGTLKFVYRRAIKGFAVANLAEAAVQALQRNPRIAMIERDGIVTADGAGTQTGATWGIDRIDQRDLPLNGTYNYDGDGTGVTAYIIDTGIRISHNEFGTPSRASGGFTAINDGNGTNDCHGHGTHVAGTVGGSTYGVAQNVNLVAVRVLGCGGSGSTSGVIAGIDWVTLNHANNAVANMSLGGSASSALDAAVENSIADGVTYAVAAGNSNADACNSSPSRAPNALTVASTTSTDAKSSFSNWGPCVDINAPGSGITSAWNTSDVATNTISGTSMASPHVAGAAAAWLSLHLGSNPTAVMNGLKDAATAGKVTGLPGGTANLLLFTDFDAGGGGGGGGGGSPPVASISKSCNLFVCTFTASPAGASYAWSFQGDGQNATVVPPNQYRVTYGARQSGSVTVVVTTSGGSDDATITVSCNPKKCP